MNNLLQRMPQSAKVGLAAGLLVALVGSLYYFAIVRPNQLAQQALSTPTTIPTPAANNQSPATPTTGSAQPTAATPAKPAASGKPASENNSANATAQASTNTPAKSLEVAPIPFLVTESATPAATPDSASKPTVKTVVKPGSDIPPNPFVPLVVETPAPTTPTQASVAASVPVKPIAASTPTIKPAVIATPTPIPTQTATVRVTQPVRLPTPVYTPTPTATASKPTPVTKPTTITSKPTAPAKPADLVKAGGKAQLAPGGGRSSVPGVLSLGAGALPIRLTPLERELVQQPTAAPADISAASADPALDTSAIESAGNSPAFTNADPKGITGQVLEPRSSKPNPKTSVQTTQTAPANPVADYIQAQNLRLANVVLGSTNIAIFQSREGYMVVPVGSTLPSSSILLKSLNTKEALLVQGSQELNLSIENP